MYVMKTKVLISCVTTALLESAFVFTFSYSKFSHDVGPDMVVWLV